MSLKDRIVTEGMKLAGNPQVAKLMQDERFMKLVMTAMSMPGRVTTFTAEQKEHFARTMGLATADEVRDLKRIVTSLEQSVTRLRAKIEAKSETKTAAKTETQTDAQTESA
jgi:hypothetical protein